jgi:hypothetical protein
LPYFYAIQHINSIIGIIFVPPKARMIVLGINKFPYLKETQKLKIMNMRVTNDTIEMLQYQLKRYKAMKKGAACQSLQIKLNKLMSQTSNI